MNSRLALYSSLCLLGFVFSAVAASALPTITQQPASVSVASGQHATFTVVATGNGTVSYQWRRLGYPLDGAIGSTLTIAAAKLVDASFYDVEVKDGQGSTISQAAQLFVAAPTPAPIYRMDPCFTPCLASTRANSGYDYVAAVSVAADRSLIIGGDFNVYMGQRRDNLARVTSGMLLDSSFHPNVNGPVNAVVQLASGKILIGGSFSTVDGVVRKGFARLNADGALDHSLDLTSGFALAKVNAMIVQPSGSVMVAGSFGTHGTNTDFQLLRLLPSGERAPGFVPVLIDPNGIPIQAIASAFGDKTYVAYSWHLIRLQADGSVDPTFPTVGFDTFAGENRCLAVQSDGKVVIGGSLIQRLLRFNSDGTPDPTLAYNRNLSSPSGILIQPDGKLLLSGSFGSDANATPMIRLNADGTLDTWFTSSPKLDGGIVCLGAHPDGGVMIGGSFLHVGAAAVAGVARLTADGDAQTVVPGYMGRTVGVSKVLPLAGDRWLVAGGFSYVGSIPRAGLAVLQSDGSVDPSFSPGGGFVKVYETASVMDMSQDGAGRFLVAGHFDYYDGQPCARLIRLLPSGERDTTFVPGADTNFASLVTSPLGQIYVSASDLANPGYRLRRLLEQGEVDPSFQFSGGPPAFSMESSGRMLTTRWASDFWTQYLDRIMPDGTTDTTFGAGFSFRGQLGGVAVLPDGSYLLGGSFTWLPGEPFGSSLVRLSRDGSEDRRLFYWQVPPSRVDQIVPTAGGEALLRGNVDTTRAAPKSLPCLYRLGSDWSVFGIDVFDVSFPPRTIDGKLAGMHPLDDGRLLLVGVNGERGAARMTGLVLLKSEAVSPAPAIQAQPQSAIAREGTPVAFTVTAVGEGTLTYQWLKDGTVIPNVVGAKLTLANVHPIDSGGYTVVVSNDFGKATSLPATLVVHDEEQIAYADWAAAHFTPAELADPAISGPAADPDRCGFANLLRYAFKLPTRGPVAAAPVQPTTAILLGGPEYFAVTFHRKTYAPDLRYIVEGTDDLAGPWSDVREYLPGYPEEVVASDIDPMEYSVRRFLRVRVEQVP